MRQPVYFILFISSLFCLSCKKGHTITIEGDIIDYRTNKPIRTHSEGNVYFYVNGVGFNQATVTAAGHYTFSEYRSGMDATPVYNNSGLIRAELKGLKIAYPFFDGQMEEKVYYTENMHVNIYADCYSYRQYYLDNQSQSIFDSIITTNLNSYRNQQTIEFNISGTRYLKPIIIIPDIKNLITVTFYKNGSSSIYKDSLIISATQFDRSTITK